MLCIAAAVRVVIKMLAYGSNFRYWPGKRRRLVNTCEIGNDRKKEEGWSKKRDFFLFFNLGFL